MNKKKILLLCGVVGILVVIVAIALSTKSKSSFTDYVNTDIYEDFTNIDVDTSWVQDDFNDKLVKEYYTASYKGITDEELEDLVGQAPEWLVNEFYCYPDDALDYLRCIKIISDLKEVESCELSENSAYYSFIGYNTITLSINGEDTAFVFSIDEDIVYIYKIKDEIRK